MALYRVGRSFTSDRPHKSGDVVEFPESAAIRKLTEQRYLLPLASEAEAEAPTSAPDPIADVTASEASPEKRGRGRPRKIPVPPTALGSAEASE